MISDPMFFWSTTLPSTTPADDRRTHSPSRLVDWERANALDVPSATSLVAPQRLSMFNGSRHRNRNRILPLLSVSGDNRAERSRHRAGGRISDGGNSRVSNPFEAFWTRV